MYICNIVHVWMQLLMLNIVLIKYRKSKAREKNTRLYHVDNVHDDANPVSFFYIIN